MNEKETCPNCGHTYDPDEKRRELLSVMEEKMDHLIYDEASFEWMGAYELYVYLPRDDLYTLNVEDRILPDDWKIKTVWSHGDKTTVSIKLKDRNI